MSHVEKVKTVLSDIEAVKAACTRLGVEFRENQKTYEYFGRHVGDYPLPEGFSANDLGKCEHAVHVPGTNYEIGLAKNPAGKGYTALYDFYGSSTRHDGQNLLKKFGHGLTKFVDAYSVEALKRQARAKGYLTSEKTLANGNTQLTVTGFA